MRAVFLLLSANRMIDGVLTRARPVLDAEASTRPPGIAAQASFIV